MPRRVADQRLNQVAALVKKPLAERLPRLEVNRDVMRAYNERMQRELDKTALVASCYQNAAGTIVNNWPRSTLACWRHLRAPDFAAFELRE